MAKTFGRIGGDFFSYDSATPGNLTVNFTTAPLQSILGVDNSSGAYVGQTLNSRGYLATPDGSFVTDPPFPVLPGPLPLNHFLIGYGSVFVGVQNAQVVGTASVEIGTSIPLNGGDENLNIRAAGVGTFRRPESFTGCTFCPDCQTARRDNRHGKLVADRLSMTRRAPCASAVHTRVAHTQPSSSVQLACASISTRALSLSSLSHFVTVPAQSSKSGQQNSEEKQL
jgi:hypothetical protein